MERISRAERRRSRSELEKRAEWDALEELARIKLQGWIQDLLEEEITDLLGRKKSERLAAVDAPAGYRNGHGKIRRVSMMSGTLEVRRPRVRGLEERFESRILPLFVRRTKEVGELLPRLYLHGLAQGDFELALRGLLGEGAPLSASSIERLRAKWQVEFQQWKSQRLDELEVVYAWADGLYVKAGLEDTKAALLVIVGALKDGRKVVLAVESGQRESKDSWARVLRDLRDRGLRPWKVTVADGHLGIWGALRDVDLGAEEQRCWNHKLTNVIDQLPRKEWPEARKLLRKIPYAETEKECERAARSVRRPLPQGIPEGGRDAVPGLGADGDLLPFPAGSLDTPSDDEPGRVAVLGGAAANRRGEAVQEGRQRRGADLEDSDDRGKEIPASQFAGATGGGSPRTTVRGWNRIGGTKPDTSRRLISFTHLLT